MPQTAGPCVNCGMFMPTKGGVAMYESRHQAPLARSKFVRRLLGHVLVACGLIAVSLGIGMFGYMLCERLSWIDAFLVTAALLFTPLLHRLLHRFHWDEKI